MGIHRHHTWTDLAEAQEHVSVFLKLDEALEGFLADFASSSRKAYTIRAEAGSSIVRSSRTQVSAAVESLGGPADLLVGSHMKPIQGQEPGSSVSIFTQPVAVFNQSFGIKNKISCCLIVSGTDQTEINSLFDSLFSRLDVEIKRQWPKSNTVSQEVGPTTPTGRR